MIPALRQFRAVSLSLTTIVASDSCANAYDFENFGFGSLVDSTGVQTPDRVIQAGASLDLVD